MNELDLFAAAIALTDSDARAALLDKECAGQPDLRNRLDQLIAAHFQANALLDAPAAVQASDGAGGTPTISVRSADETVGTLIAGRYKLLEQIGEGGFGLVFVAEQQEPVRRKVALKVIKPGMDTRQIIARFEAERQALALMDHPNIARVLDAGATESGRPYFVMELVRGIPITDYCDQNQLAPRERLDLFVTVCQAIQHAHQKGIIHRDIKPNNVLVTSHDGKPVVKVIDFGVAKAISQHLTDRTIYTQFAQMIGTPLYMSPEQAEMSGLDIDTRSDIYSLGVLLYELLTGTTPLDKNRFAKAAYDEIRRLIREEEPPRPSTRLSTTESLASIAAQRHTEPAKLSKLVRGDLDWITMKCLEKDRTRRYETANGLARDIQRYLGDEPVEACPPSATYRLRKFARKNRAALTTTAAIALLLVTGILVSTWQAVRAMRAEHRALTSAAAERVAKLDAQEKENLARAAAEKERTARLEEEAISDFVIDDFLALTSVEGQERSSDGAEEGLSKDATLRQLLDRAAAKLRARKDLNPRVEAKLCWIIGVNYRASGETTKAIEFLERAVQLRTEQFGRDHDDTLTAMNSLAVAYQEAGFSSLGKAIALFEENLKHLEKRSERDPSDYVSRMANLGLAYTYASKLDTAVPLLERALRLAQEKLEPGDSDVIRVMSVLGRAYRVAGKLDLALPMHERALELSRKSKGPDSQRTLQSMEALAVTYQDAGKLDLALPLFEEVLKLSNTKLGAGDSVTGRRLSQLAVAFIDAGKQELLVPLLNKFAASKAGGAERSDLAQKFLEVRSQVLEEYILGRKNRTVARLEVLIELIKTHIGAEDELTLDTMQSLAVAYSDNREFDRALSLYQEIAKIQTTKSGPEDESTLNSRITLAYAYKEAGKLETAEKLLEEVGEVVSVQMRKFGPDHESLYLNTRRLVGAYRSAGQIERALPFVEAMMQRNQEKYGPEHPQTLAMLSELAWNYRWSGRYDSAIGLVEKLWEARRKSLPEGDKLRIDAQNQLGATLLEAGRFDDAESHLLASYRDASVSKDTPKEWLTGYVIRLANLYAKWKKPTEAARWHGELFSMMENLKTSGDSSAYALATSSYGRTLLDQGNWKDAERYVREGLSIREKRLPNDWRTFNSMSMLGGALLGQARNAGDETTRAKRLAEAESRLVKGYEGMKARENSIMKGDGSELRIPEALDRLIELYTATKRPDEAKKWKAERAKYPDAKPADTR